MKIIITLILAFSQLLSPYMAPEITDPPKPPKQPEQETEQPTVIELPETDDIEILLEAMKSDHRLILDGALKIQSLTDTLPHKYLKDTLHVFTYADGISAQIFSDYIYNMVKRDCVAFANETLSCSSGELQLVKVLVNYQISDYHDVELMDDMKAVIASGENEAVTALLRDIIEMSEELIEGDW